MKALLLTAILMAALSPFASASQATQTTITITGQTPGPKPFISKLSLSVSDLPHLRQIRFTVRPKEGSVTRPLSALYPKAYLASRGYVDATNGQVTVPVFGLYDGYDNTVKLTYFFADGSSKSASTIVQTAVFDDPCKLNTPVVRQARTSSTALSYDYILAASSCSVNSPTILDTDGAVRWVGTAGLRDHYTAFYRNGVYTTQGTRLFRMELDGEVRLLADYADENVVSFNHNIDPGKKGIILDVNTTSYIDSVHLEVDATTGAVLKKWNLADIISAAMVAGGDDPSGFVRKANGHYDFGAFEDWAHNNAVAYRKSDNSIIISSRENFVICIDYDSGAIKWILGDTTKQWYGYASLRKFALDPAPGTITPDGQHAVSITKDDSLLLFDNGQRSAHHSPPGPNRAYSAPRKYSLDLVNRTATEVWNFTNNQSVRSPFRSSVYEDAPNNYLVNYAQAQNPNGTIRAELLGLTPNGETVFDYSYPTATCCDESYRSLPVHWERIVFVAPAP